MQGLITKPFSSKRWLVTSFLKENKRHTRKNKIEFRLKSKSTRWFFFPVFNPFWLRTIIIWNGCNTLNHFVDSMNKVFLPSGKHLMNSNRAMLADKNGLTWVWQLNVIFWLKCSCDHISRANAIGRFRSFLVYCCMVAAACLLLDIFAQFRLPLIPVPRDESHIVLKAQTHALAVNIINCGVTMRAKISMNVFWIWAGSYIAN